MALPGILRRLLEHINNKAAHGLSVGRKFSVSGGATAAPVTFHGTEDVNLVVTSLDMTKMTDGVLPATSGGTGRDDGKAPAWTETRTITLYGDVMGATAFDGSADISLVTSLGLTPAPRPQAAAGLGQWCTVTQGSKGRISLPAGGAWAWFGFTPVSVYVGESLTPVFGGVESGVSAGGTEFVSYKYTHIFCWRIA